MPTISQLIICGSNSKAQDAVKEKLKEKIAVALQDRKQIVAKTFAAVTEDVEVIEESNLNEAVSAEGKKIRAHFKKLAKAKNASKYVEDIEAMQSRTPTTPLAKMYRAIEDDKERSKLIFDLDELLGGFEFEDDDDDFS